ncbi:MAG: pirin family protein, partial [Calditrichaeota bacterium]|nr:pirin family protein [Calditrichota bacterium]
MKSIIHRSETRGHANHGWLDTHHTFSFADYHNPERVHFGALRVLNDDIVAPGMGFATHGHQDMEIISIALEGELEHQDSMGNVHVIKKDDVQVMSAGTGIRHSEKNRSQSQHTNFLQIWVFPREHGVKPRYQQMNFPRESKKNHLLNVIGPDQSGSTLWIHQHAWL